MEPGLAAEIIEERRGDRLQPFRFRHQRVKDGTAGGGDFDNHRLPRAFNGNLGSDKFSSERIKITEIAKTNIIFAGLANLATAGDSLQRGSEIGDFFHELLGLIRTLRGASQTVGAG